MSASAASGSPSPSTPLIPKVPCPASRASLLRATAVAWRNARRFERDLPWLRFSSCASVASMRVPRVPTQLCVNRAILPSKASVAALTNCSSRVARVVNSRCAFARVSRTASAAARHLDAAVSARDARSSWPASTRAMSPPPVCRVVNSDNGPPVGRFAARCIGREKESDIITPRSVARASRPRQGLKTRSGRREDSEPKPFESSRGIDPY